MLSRHVLLDVMDYLSYCSSDWLLLAIYCIRVNRSCPTCDNAVADQHVDDTGGKTVGDTGATYDDPANEHHHTGRVVTTETRCNRTCKMTSHE